MKLRLSSPPLASACVCLLFSAMSVAQKPQAQASAAPASDESLPPLTVQIAPPPLSFTSLFGISSPLGGQPALDNPLAAEIVTEHHQTFSDGNRIARSTQSSLFRDAAGRMRRESQLSIPGLPAGITASALYITIVDRELGFGFVLDPQERVAHRYPLNAQPPAYVARLNAQSAGAPLLAANEGAGKEAPAQGSESRWRLHSFTHRLLWRSGGGAANDNGKAASSGLTTASFAADGMQAAPPIDVSPMPPPLRIDQPFLAAPNPVRTENLGEQTILGYRCTGSRVITTLPAGQIGNDRPIDIVSEQWYSPELELVMRSMHRDPWAGELVTTVLRVSRGEQPAPLFAVPSSFKIVDASEEREHHVMDGHDHSMIPLK